jgi:hypothetical protein
MLKRHTVTLHQVITVYNEMFDHMDGVMRALAKKKTEWKEYIFFAVKLARQRLSKYYSEVTPMTDMLLVSKHILDPFTKLRLFRKTNNGMHIYPEDETSYSTHYQEVFLKNVKNKYAYKHRRVQVNKLQTVRSRNLVPSAKGSGCYKLSLDYYYLSSNDDEYQTSNNVDETTPGRSVRARTPASGLIGIRMVNIGIRLQTWT